jgi:SNF2 family DNA or RNA helicase
MQLAWAENMVRKTNKPALILTPLAVAQQTYREANKFNIEANVSRDGSIKPNITITNYEKLHLFSPNDFSGVVCDESSCIKAMDGKRRAEVTEFLRTVHYRLLCTATAAPNDYVELGTSSEALGEMGQRDMITKFFRTEQKKGHRNWSALKYTMRGHAQIHFWRWVCSWARACRKPSDLGFDDADFILPPLEENEYVVKARTLRPGFLFDMPATNLLEEQEERRRTINERCEKVAELMDTGKQAVIWCHLNPEGDLLAKIIPDAKQVRGCDSLEKKEETYEAFTSGQLRVLVIKPKIGAYGLNWQFCSQVGMFASHSYEQSYQLIRRCWRFGQKEAVRVYRVLTEGEERIAKNLAAKRSKDERMFKALIEQMQWANRIEKPVYTEKETVPAWL